MTDEQIAKLAMSGETPAPIVGGYMPTRAEWVEALRLLRDARVILANDIDNGVGQKKARISLIDGIARLVEGRE